MYHFQGIQITNQNLMANYYFIVEATSDSGVAVVEFFIDNMWVGSAHNESYNFSKNY